MFMTALSTRMAFLRFLVNNTAGDSDGGKVTGLSELTDLVARIAASSAGADRPADADE